MLEAILVISTLLGGIAAVGYLAEKLRTRRVARKRIERQPVAADEARRAILLVEDDGRLAEDLKRMFEPYQANLQITVARDAGEAIDHLQSALPDAVLLDLMLPYGSAAGMLDADSDPAMVYGGSRVLRWLRTSRDPRATSVPVWVLTARSSVGVRKELEDLGVQPTRVFFKPFDTLQLEHEVVTALGIPSQLPSGLP